ncbi:MAG: hypothetical protein DRJ15_03285 [Bacteroidetes bacterium]|nr:MAG: hypothetical protein DRJ15_03285 [Bacteroidota bacterium]
MKKLIIALFALVLLVPLTQAQESVTQELYEKYSGTEGITTVHITKELFGMIAQMNFEGDEAEDMNEMKDAMAGLEFIKIVMFENGSVDNKDFVAFKEDLGAFDLDGYSELMVVDDKDEKIRFVARQDGDMIKEFLILISSENEVGFISIFGDMDMETISKVSQGMGIQEMGKFGGHDDDDE